jgi:hypothetical protein
VFSRCLLFSFCQMKSTSFQMNAMYVNATELQVNASNPDIQVEYSFSEPPVGTMIEVINADEIIRDIEAPCK